MKPDSGQRLSKQERAAQRRRAARLRKWRRRLQVGLVVGPILLLPMLWGYDCTGPEELVRAEVVSTQRWQHVTPGSGSHTHIRATLLIEGRNEAVIQRADGFARGQWVAVWIRRGRLTGWPYFQDLAQPGALEEAPEAAVEEPVDDEGEDEEGAEPVEPEAP